MNIKFKIGTTIAVLGILALLIIPKLEPLPEEMPLGAGISAPSEGDLVGYWTMNESDLTEGTDIVSG